MSIFVRKITIWSYGYFIINPIVGLGVGVLSGGVRGKNRQIATVKNS